MMIIIISKLKKLLTMAEAQNKKGLCELFAEAMGLDAYKYEPANYF